MAPRLRLLDITALVLTVLATIIHFVGCFIPNWWTYQSYKGKTLVVGIIESSGCDLFGRCDQSIINIDGGKEWLFMARIFELFGVILCLVATVVHIIFVPTRNFNIRAAAIYALGAGGLFILAGSIVFVSMCNDLETNVDVNTGTSKVGPGFGICLLSGIVTVAASIVTGIATVNDDYYYADKY